MKDEPTKPAPKPTRPPLNALVTGATGFLGQHLLARLGKSVVLTRDPERASERLRRFQPRIVGWDAESQRAPSSAFADVDAVFHLAGESVGEGRWTKEKKRRLVDSRIAGTRNLVSTLLALPHKPRVLISASAVGYYSDRGEEILDETDKPGRDFLADLCVQWEREAMRASEAGIRVVPVRIGMVLGPDGGALKRLLPVFRFGLGSALGSGSQYVSWIHVDDLVALMLFAAQKEDIVGPINGTSPHPVTNREFTKALARSLRSLHLLPGVPGFMLRLMLGEFGGVLLHSQQVLPRAALQAGFRFQFPGIDAALEDIVRQSQAAPEASETANAPRAWSQAQANR
jgi:uncharacterized protein